MAVMVNTSLNLCRSFLRRLRGLCVRGTCSKRHLQLDFPHVEGIRRSTVLRLPAYIPSHGRTFAMANEFLLIRGKPYNQSDPPNHHGAYLILHVLFTLICHYRYIPTRVSPPRGKFHMKLEESYAGTIVMQRAEETLRVAEYSIVSSLTPPQKPQPQV